MAPTIDTKKAPSLLTPDWSSQSNKSDPFFLRAEEKTVNGSPLRLQDRYAVTVVTDFKSTGKTRAELKRRMTLQKEKGLVRILNFYNKNTPDRSTIDIVVEGWSINPRPNSRLKVLVSVSTLQIDPLPSILEAATGLENAVHIVNFDTSTLEKKIDNLRQLLLHFDSETRTLFGRIPRLDFKSQAVKIDQVVPAISKLMLDNELLYERSSTTDLIFGIAPDFTPAYMAVRDGECVKPLDNNFQNFRRTPSFGDQRTVNFLNNLDHLNDIYLNKDKISIQDFVEQYVLNPPRFDYSSRKPFSTPAKNRAEAAKEKASKKTSKSYADYTSEERAFGSKEMKEELASVLDSSAEFVGDKIIGNLRELSNLTPSINDVYGKVLNKVPIRGIIESALECLNFRGLEFLQVSKQFLNEAADLASEIKTSVFEIPSIYLKDDLPITDYLVGMVESIVRGVISSLLSTLYNLVMELIKMLLDFCKECALQNETQGRGRFDGLNFGGMSAENVLSSGAQSFVAASLGAIQTGITSTRFELPGGVRTSVAEQNQKVISQTEQYAQNPLLMPGVKEVKEALGAKKYNEYTGDEKLQQDLLKQADQAKEEMTGFMDAASSVLTPAELGNMMLGCGVSQDAIDAVDNLLSNYPSIPIQGDDDILRFFADVGKFSGFSNVLETVKEINDNLPEEYKCLCDPDDTALREQLLENKDMSPELIKEQIDASKDRERKRLTELNDLLNKDNILDGMLPPVYCSVDSSGNVIPGLLSKNHPKHDFTIDTTLRSLYDSIATTFNRDATSYVPTVTLTPTVERIVPRTVERVIDGNRTILFNNEFLDLVGKGTVAFGALPPGARDKNGTQMQNGVQPPASDFKFIHWLGNDTDINQTYGTSIDASDLGDSQDQAIGMNRPFPESENLYAALNIDSDFYQNADRSAIGGRKDPKSFYTKKYGYSPVPILVKERGTETFAPGFQEVYRTFCFKNEEKIKITEERGFQRFKFNVPNNLLSNLNIDLSSLAGSVGADFFTPQDTRGTKTADELSDGFQEAISGLFGKINELGFSLNYIVPAKDGWTPGKEEYLFTVAADTPTAFQETAGGAEQLTLNAQADIIDINPSAIQSYEDRNLVPLDTRSTFPLSENTTPQERMFVNLVEDSLDNGPTLFSNLIKRSDKEEYLRGVPGVVGYTAPGATIGSVSTTDKLKSILYRDDSYNEVWKDIFCSFTNQIASDANPFFDLKNLQSLDLAPMKIEDQECPPHLLDIDALKARIKQEYSVIQCIETSFPNVTGLGSNKNNPFEKANLGGVVLLLLRTYITEMFMRSLHIFYWFRYKKPEDVDDLMVLYVSRYITTSIQNEGFLPEFETEVIDLYDRNKPSEPQEPTDLNLDRYNVAMKFLVRQQIWAVANRVSRLVGAKGDTSLDTILLEEWIRTVDVQKEYGESRLSEPCKSLSSELEYLNDNLLDAISTGGLSRDGIDRISLLTEAGPSGFLFREYYGNNPHMPAIRGTTSKDGIWSLNVDAGGTPQQRIGGSALSELVDGGSSNIYSASKVSLDREAQILASSGLAQPTSLTPNNWNWDFLKNNWNNLENMLTYRAVVSNAEKEAMSTVIKFTAAAAAPGVFNEATVGNIGAKKINGVDYYPGYYLKKSLDANSLGNYRSDFITLNLNDQFEDRFDVKYMPTYGVEYASVDRETFTFRGGNSYILNEYFFHLNVDRPGWSPKPNTVGGSTITGRQLNDYFTDKYQAAFISLWQNENNPAKTGVTDLGGSLPVVDGHDITNEYTRESEWSRPFPRQSAGFPQHADEPSLEIYLADNRYIVVGKAMDQFSNERDVLIENFYPRTLVDWLGNQHQFRSNYVQPRRPIEEVNITELDADQHWSYANPNAPAQFYLPPTYEQYKPTSFGSPSPIEEVLATNFPPEVLNPNGNRDSFHERLFYHTVLHMDNSSAPSIPYFSLLDLDPLSIVQVLNWEKEQANNDPTTTFAAKQLLIEKYDKWISEYSNVYQLFDSSEGQRFDMRSDIISKVNQLPPARRKMEQPLTCDFTNGGLLLEPYIRATRYQESDVDNLDLTAAGKTTLRNNIQKVESTAARDIYLDGIINIDKFQDFVNQIVGIQRLERQSQRSPDLVNGGCGAGLPNSPNVIRRFTNKDIQLGDYFKEVNLGLRISYVPEPSKISGLSSNQAQIQPPDLGISLVDITGKSKAYYVEEVSGSVTKQYNIIPITSTETPFDPNLSIADVTALYEGTTVPKLDNNGFLINSVPEQLGFFKAASKEPSGLRNLMKQMNQTDDYALLFKYMFPIDKMLSINNIYSNTYLSTIKNVDTVFDATKEELRQLLFTLLDSGNYQASSCAPSNREFMDSLLNGFPIKGLAGQLAITLLKSSLLIFKGFMETADINILLSRRIIDLIHVVNQSIASSQQLINQGSQAITATAQGISDLGSAIGDIAGDIVGVGCNDLLAPGSCKAQSSVTPSRPDGTLFDPIEENFIPEPQTWAVSLALLPATLFAPFFFGPPLTLPFGFVYWALDYKPEPNWMNSTPPSDWLNKLFNQAATGAPQAPYQPGDSECRADLGLPSPAANESQLNEYYNNLNRNSTQTDSSNPITGSSSNPITGSSSSPTSPPPASPIGHTQGGLNWGTTYQERANNIASAITRVTPSEDQGRTGGISPGFDRTVLGPTGSSG